MTGVILGACDVSSYVDREIIQFEVGIFTIKVLPLCDLHIFQYFENSCIIFSDFFLYVISVAQCCPFV